MSPTRRRPATFGAPPTAGHRPLSAFAFSLRPTVGSIPNRPPLTEPLEVTGHITVHLAAATSARDTDFTAKLTDVYPDGRSMLITDSIVRASYRNSLEKADFLTPGQQYDFDIDVGSTSLIFNQGHRLRVAISSSNSPRFEANRNNGKSWPADQNYPSVVAHQTIFLGGSDASAIVLPQVVGSTGQ